MNILNLQDKHPADIAKQLASLDPKSRDVSFLFLSSEKKSEVFPYFDTELQQEIIKSLGDKDIAEVMNNLEPDDRTAIFESFPDDLIKHLVNLLDNSEKETALNLIGYPKDSIARLMTPQYVQARPNWTVGETLQHIKKHGKNAETLSFIYIVNKKMS